MKIDICIPAYNEGRLIKETVREVARTLQTIPDVQFQIIVADNGSDDDTAEASKAAGAAVLHVPARGKGAAVIAAARASKADIFGFIDADLSANPNDIPKLISSLTQHTCDIAVGSRLLDASMVKREGLRTFLSRLFNLMRKAALGVKIEDTQCGLKFMNSRGRDILRECLETGWFFDIEFLARAECAGLQTREIPIHWDEHRFPGRESRLKLLRDGFGALGALIRIYFRIRHTPAYRRSLRLVNGSILSNFKHLELSTADEKEYSLDMTPLTRVAIKLIGVPHLGFRVRAAIILHEMRRLKRSCRILDAGCGYGLYAMSLAELSYTVDAVDVEAKRINALHAMIEEYTLLEQKLSLFTGSLTFLPFPVESYDAAVCSEVIEHIKDDLAAVSELARVLKPGGTLAISVPYDSTYNKKVYRRFDHERPGYNKKSLSELMNAHGLRIEKTFYYERSAGRVLFDMFNSLHSKPLMGILFYPFYILYVLDYYVGIGEPSQMVVIAKKN